MMSARFAGDPVFGDVARALGPRSCGAHARRPEPAAWLRVGFTAEALPPADRAGWAHRHLTRLAAATSCASSTHPGSFEGQERETLSCPRSVLAEMEPRNDVVAALLAAHDNACRPLSPVRLMGVVNVTPDSFSEGGRFLDPERAIEHGLRLVDEGASYLDIGGESTRPGAKSIDAETELARVLPVVQGLAERTRIPISIDTTKASVAEAAIDSGATIVNDISAGSFDARMLAVVAASGAGFIAMHMQGTPRDMQIAPTYGDCLTEITEYLRGRARVCLEAGIERSRMWIDPGIGFGKRLEHNLEILAELGELRSLGLGVCLGVSRKSFIAAVEDHAGRSHGRSDPGERTGGTAAALAIGVWNGAEILRVHDVRVMLQAVRVAEAIAVRNRSEVRG